MANIRWIRAAQQPPIVLKASTVLDGRGGVVRNTAIVVDGPTITRLDPAAQGTVYDLTGLTVMPGWIDTHIHSGSGFEIRAGRAFPRDASPEQQMLYEMENLYQTLMGGFTTVQSLGSARRDLDARAWIESGRLPGPRLLTSLRSVDHNTGNPDAIRAFVRSVVADGADVIKILATASVRDGGAPTMSFEQVFAACDEARKLKRRSAVHAHTRRHHQRGRCTTTRAGDHEPARVCCRSGHARDRHALGAPRGRTEEFPRYCRASFSPAPPPLRQAACPSLRALGRREA